MPDQRILPSGPVFIAEHAQDTRSFVAGLWFPTGSRHEAPEERGFAHFVEHMLFKGTLSRDAATLAREFDRHGGYVNAFTEKDCICLHATVPVSAWEGAVDILCDMAFASIFPPEEFLREKEVVVSEILQVEDDPDEKSHDELLGRIWPGDPASLPTAGTVEGIRVLDRDACLAWYHRVLSPRTAIIAVSSPCDVDAVAARFNKAIEEVSGSLTGATTPSMGSLHPGSLIVQQTPRFIPCTGTLASRSTMQIYCYEAVQLDPPFTGNDFYTMAALNSVVGDSSSSRLFQELRESRGLCYSVGSGFVDSRTECLWLAQVITQPSTFPAMVKELETVLFDLGREGPTAVECADAVSRLLGSYEIALDDPEFRMRRLARQYMSTGGILSQEETARRYASIQAVDIRDLAVRLFRDAPRARFAFGKTNPESLRILRGEARAHQGR